MENNKAVLFELNIENDRCIFPNTISDAIIDANKENNHVSNIEWCTPEQNAQHALKTGLRKGYVHVDVKREMLERALQGELIYDLALEVGNHPNTLSRMLRVQAEKDGRIHEWKEETARKRKNTALKNLEIINARN